jgi:transposase
VSVRDSIAADLALINHYEVVIGELEGAVLRQARVHDPNALRLLTTLPGIGRVLGLTILYEIHDIRRFPSVQDFASYSRLVKCEKNSAGKKLGTGGDKIGNAYLKRAFSARRSSQSTRALHGIRYGSCRLRHLSEEL